MLGLKKMRPVGRYRWLAALCAVPAFLGAGYLLAVGNHTALKKGPIVSGHAELGCIDCHTEQAGTFRQELQTNVKYALGMRETYVPLGYHAVETATCLACHDRKTERHPVFRFQEPRFQDAIAEIDARSCLTCHQEHTGFRVTVADMGFCVACHEDLSLKADPVNVPHTTLIAQKDWASCLGCHDFHGNHAYDVPVHTDNQISVDALEAYLDGGADPYAPTKKEEGLRP